MIPTEYEVHINWNMYPPIIICIHLLHVYGACIKDTQLRAIGKGRLNCGIEHPAN